MFTFLPHISRIFFSSSLGFVCGVFVASFFYFSTDVILFVTCIVTICVFIFFYRNTFMWSIIIFLVLFSVGFFVTVTYSAHVERMVTNGNGHREGVARVVSDIEQKSFYSHVYVQYNDENFITLLKDDKHTTIARGDIVKLSCERSVPESFDDFDYRGYLAMRHVYFVCENHQYTVIGHENDVLSYISQARIEMEKSVNEIIPAPESALANGLLFGGSARLSKKMQDDFSQTGMTHIVAVSGYNVSIIIAVMMGILIFIGFHRRWAVWGSIMSVVFFVALIGFPSSGMRAAIMGIMVLVAASYGRVTHAYSAILFSAAIMLFFNPLLLRYDIGFQLSFLATLGIIAIYPVVERLFINRKMAFGIVEVLLLTLSAQIFVLPIIAYHFHTFSTVSLLVNLLVLPIIPITMFFVFFLVMWSFIFYPIAVFCGWIAYLFLKYEVFIISFFADLPFCRIQIEHFSVSWMVVYYGIVIGILFYVNHKSNIYER